MQIWRPTFLYTLTFLLPHGCSAPGDREAGNLCQAVQLRAIPAPAAGDNEASPPPQVLKSLACEKFTLKRSIMLLFCWGLSCLTLRVSAKISTWHAHGNSTWGGAESKPTLCSWFVFNSFFFFFFKFVFIIIFFSVEFWPRKWWDHVSWGIILSLQVVWGEKYYLTISMLFVLRSWKFFLSKCLWNSMKK